MSARILLIDDDRNLSGMVKEYLETKDFDITLCFDGNEGLQVFHSHSFDLCLLDVKMPVKDGFLVAEEIRDTNTQIPIIFLTGQSMKDDRIKGFQLGADDYVTKPFSLEELYFRITAILKRTGNQKQQSQPETHQYSIGKYLLNIQTRELHFEGQSSVRLSAKEANLLKYLILHKNQVLKREVALKEVWGENDYYKSMSMNVYITKLRKYLRDDSSIQIINIHGEGYKLITS